MKRFVVVAIALFALPLRVFPQVSSEKYIGKAGDIYISEHEFRDRFEMLPSLYRQRKPQLQQAKLELLYSLIAEKLLAQEAEERKLDRDPIFQSTMLNLRKVFARDQLYREEVAEKVTMTEQEVAAGMQQAVQEVLISFMYFDKRDDAVFVRNQITDARSFDRLVLDSTMAALRDTATIIWGDADETIQNEAYRLKKNDVSPVIEAGDGYYILRKNSSRTSSFFSSMQPAVLHERVEAAIRRKEERHRMTEFLRDAFNGKKGYARPDALRKLADCLVAVFQEQVHSDSAISLSAPMVDELRRRCSTTLHDTLAVAGDVRWSVDDVIDKLYRKRFTVSRATIPKMFARLNVDVGFWVQQELLAQEGLRRRLDQRPEIHEQIQMWRQSSLADMMKAYARDHVMVTGTEVWEFMKFKDREVTIPTVRIQELRTSTLEEMKEALAELEAGQSFDEVVVKWSSDPDLRAKKGRSDAFPVTTRQPIGDIAYHMSIGERYGPIRTPEGIVYFQLLEKDTLDLPADTSLAAKQSAAEQELLRLKQQTTINMFVAQTAQHRGVDIYEDRLKQIDVTPTPMMTFRFLGFGGRMFAVPFVEPLLQWVNMEPPQQPVLP